MHSYEIEIKCLLGSKKDADRLFKGMNSIDPNLKVLSKSKQLNHYFIGGNMGELFSKVAPLFGKNAMAKLKAIIKSGEDFSVRTRLLDEIPLLVVKASIDDNTSANGVSRIEFEEKVMNMTLDELDQLLLSIGFAYQAKWSREREEYICKETNICLDKNAGYGYIAEFERVVSDITNIDNAKKKLRDLMKKLGVEELSQDRLERMFAHYNKHWQDYYGTERIFVVE